MLNLVVTHLLGIAARWLGLKAYGVLDLFNLRHDAYLFADSSLASLFAYTVFVIGPVEELVKFLPVLARGHSLPRLRRTARRHNLRVFRGPRLYTVREFSLCRVCSGCGGFCARSGIAPRADNVCVDLGIPVYRGEHPARWPGTRRIDGSRTGRVSASTLRFRDDRPAALVPSALCVSDSFCPGLANASYPPPDRSILRPNPNRSNSCARCRRRAC